MNKPLETLNKHLSDGVNTPQTMQCDVVNGHQGVASNDAQNTCVLLYDVNAGHTDFSIELCNTLLKDGWKKHTLYLDAHCLDFSLWRKQSDFQFGFVPLTNLIIPDNGDHFGDKVHHPIEQHTRVKSTGIPNFLGERIPIKSHLNVDKWEKCLVAIVTNSSYI